MQPSTREGFGLVITEALWKSKPVIAAVNGHCFTGSFELAMCADIIIASENAVFGDTHVAVVERRDGTLLVNPGSPTLPNGLFELGTVGLLEITGNRAEARIIQLSEFPLPFHHELIYY